MNAQDLKNSILELAIKGKLVGQREEEGTAKELLDQINAEKEQLIKEKKIKKEKPLPEIKEDEKLFDIPVSWEWVRLNNIFNFIDYRGKTPTKISDGVVLITASNIRKGYLDFTKEDFISETEYNERMSRGITRKGDLLFTTEAPLGNIAINAIEVASCGQRVITFQQYGERKFLNELISFFLQSPSFQRELLNNATGTTAKGIKAARLKNLIIPFPPLEEQKRIVAKIEELMPYVEKYDKAFTKVEELNNKFPGDMQKSILQYAIQGKLVEQREEEGTAEEFYQQIQEEKKKLVKEGKIKKQKSLAEITEDEMPFDIPETWKWVRLGDIGEIVGGGTPKTNNQEFWKDGNIPWLTPADMKNVKGKYVKHGDRNITEAGLRVSSARLMPKGTVIYSSRAPIGYIAIAENELSTNQGFKSLVPFKIGISEYIYYYLIARTNEIISRASGTTFKEISGREFGKTVVPLPPLEEQLRIVEKIEELLPYIKQLAK